MARRRKKKAAPDSLGPGVAHVPPGAGRAVTSLATVLKEALAVKKPAAGARVVQSDAGRPPTASLPPPPPSPPIPDSPGIDARELRLLNDAYEGTTPLAQVGRKSFERAARRMSVAPPRQAAAETSDDRMRRRLGALVGEGVHFAISEQTLPGEAVREGVSRRELRRLRSPNFHAEATLDLHGEPAAVVDLRVNRFVREHHRRGCRYLLVIHGKGLHSQSGEGVLGGAVFVALTRGGAAPLVRALSHPHEQLGGRGATAVALM